MTYGDCSRGFSVNQLVKSAFNSKLLQEAFAVENDYKGDSHISHIFVAVDPAAGGQRSKYAITSHVYPRGEGMVVSHTEIVLFFVFLFFLFLFLTVITVSHSITSSFPR